MDNTTPQETLTPRRMISAYGYQHDHDDACVFDKANLPCQPIESMTDAQAHTAGPMEQYGLNHVFEKHGDAKYYLMEKTAYLAKAREIDAAIAAQQAELKTLRGLLIDILMRTGEPPKEALMADLMTVSIPVFRVRNIRSALEGVDAKRPDTPV